MLRKTLAGTAIAASAGFALALANGEDRSNMPGVGGMVQANPLASDVRTPGGSSADPSEGRFEQFPGIPPGNEAGTVSDGGADATPPTHALKHAPIAKAAGDAAADTEGKTCIDHEGISYRHGQRGYDRCRHEKK